MLYVYPETAMIGSATCGIAMCGIYGVYENLPIGPKYPPVPTPIIPPVNQTFVEDPGNPGWGWYFPTGSPNNNNSGWGGWYETVELYVYFGGLVSPTVGSPGSLGSKTGHDIYPLKGSLNWDVSVSDSVSSCSFTIAAPPTGRVSPGMKVDIGLGYGYGLNQNDVIFSGVIQKVTETYITGVPGELILQYSCSAVGWEHILVRKTFTKTYDYDTYAGDIILDMLDSINGTSGRGDGHWEVTTGSGGRTSKYVYPSAPPNGIYGTSFTIKKGAIIESITFDNEEAMSVITRLEEASKTVAVEKGGGEYVHYVDPFKRLWYVSKSTLGQAAFGIQNAWIRDNTWKFPKNNFSELSISEDNSQQVETSDVNYLISVKGKEKVMRQVVYYDPYTSDYPSILRGSDVSSTNVYVHPIADQGQRSFFTGDPIYEVEWLWACWAQEKQKLVYNRVDTGDTTKGSVSNTEKLVEAGEYFDNYGFCLWKKPVIEDLKAYLRRQKGSRTWALGYYQTQTTHLPQAILQFLGVSDPSKLWRPTCPLLYGFHPREGSDHATLIEWYSDQKSGIYSDQERMEWEVSNPGKTTGAGAPGTAGEKTDEIDYTWEFSYDANTFDFKEDAPISFRYLTMFYSTMVPKTYKFLFGDNATGCTKIEITDDTATTSALASTAAQKEYTSRCSGKDTGSDITASYTHFQRGMDIIDKKLQVGSTQSITVRNRNLNLVVESIRYSLKFGPKVPIFQLDVSLGTKPTTVANILKNAIQVQ